MRSINWKKRLIQAVWLLAGIGTVVLMGAAMQQKSQKRCSNVKIEITGVEEHMFIDENDIIGILNKQTRVIGTPVRLLNLREMETGVEKNPWVKNAEMFFDNQQVLQVAIEERQPVARIFTVSGQSYYLDSTGMRLPLSEKLSARVPMFTNFPSDKRVLAKPDSALLRDVVGLGQFILADSFWMAQVAQVAITPQAGFELIPVIGEHIVHLGNGDHLSEKFSRLYTFYKQAWLQKGIHYYERLDVQYQNQVVATKRGTTKALVDSLEAARLVQDMITAPAQQAVDTVVKQATVPVPVKQTVKETQVAKTVTNTNNKINTNPLSKKVEPKTPAPIKKEDGKKVTPKAVMGARPKQG